MNWRRSYNELVGDIRNDLRQMREAGASEPRHDVGRPNLTPPRDMTDAEIDDLARRYAAQRVEHSMNRSNEAATVARSRKRAGLAF